jgi:putative hemolysin
VTVWLPWISLASLALASCLSAINLALLSVSRAAIERRLEETGRAPRAAWLARHRREAVMSTALLRTAARMAFFVLILAQIPGVFTDATAWGRLAIAGSLAVIVLWLVSTVISAAVAQYAGVALLTRSLLVVQAITFLCYPLNRVGSFLDEIVRRLTGAHLQQEEIEAELLRSIEETQRQGGLDFTAATILENVVEFTSTEVSEIMTPRTDVQGIRLTDDLNAVRAAVLEAGHSRIPVYRENLDQIAGILYAKDLIPFLGVAADDFHLEPLLRRPIVVPESKPVRELLAEFQKSEVHMAIVIDEYGGTAGLVTIEDVLEEIVGEIRDEHEPEDEDEPELVILDDAHAEVDGRFHIDDLNDRLGLSLPEDDDYETIGGYLLANLGHVPVVGETFESHNARFITTEATPTHVVRVAIELLQPVPSNGNADNHGEPASK